MGKNCNPKLNFSYAKCEYIRQNPVKAGLVGRPEDYPWLWVNPEI
jgi:hypothetical protein